MSLLEQSSQSIKSVDATPKVIRAYIRFSKPSFREGDPEKPKNAVEEKLYITRKVQDTKDSIIKYAIDKNLALKETDIRWYVDDGVSGGSSYLIRKINNIIEESKPGDVVIFFELSRIARRMLDVSEICNRLMRAKAEVHCINPPLLLQDDLQSAIYVMAFGVASEIERSMIIMRTNKALQTRKERGIQLGRKKGVTNIKSVCSPYKATIEKFISEGRSQLSISQILKIKYTTLRAFIKKNNLMIHKLKVVSDAQIDLEKNGPA